MPESVTGTERIGLPKLRLVDPLPLNTGVRAPPPPFDAAPLIEAMWWHPMYDADPGHRYPRDVVVRAAQRTTP